MKVEKEYLIIHDEEEISLELVNNYKKDIEKLIKHVPLQYITNHQEFMKLDFYVDENVLIPRADTENLVIEVINYCNRNVKSSYKILDLCSGSGAIGISIAKYIENAEVLGADISYKAIEIAKKNARQNKVDNIHFIYSNMFSNIQDTFDIIVSNPPYIKSSVIKKLQEEVQNEPHIALDGGDDGLDFYRIIVDNGYKYLNEDGILFLEIGYDEKEDIIELLEKSNKYNNIYSKKDLYENDRIVVADKLL